MAGDYRIYAVRCAGRDTSTSEVFDRDTARAPIGMDYFVWALTDGAVVVDLGFTEAVGTAGGRTVLRCPSRGLAELGIVCARVDDVIVSHFVEDVCAMVRLNYEGRVAFVDGEKEIVPDISVHTVGGHTAGMADHHGGDAPGPRGRRVRGRALRPESRGGDPVQHASRPARHVVGLRAHPRARGDAGADPARPRLAGDGASAQGGRPHRGALTG